MSASITFKKKNPNAVISTKFGDINIRFYTDMAPIHVENFLSLTKIGFYDGTTFPASYMDSSFKLETRSVKNRIEACTAKVALGLP